MSIIDLELLVLHKEEKMKERKLTTSAHCVYNLKYHLVFVVAYRRKAITSSILQCLGSAFSEVCASFHAEVIEFSGKADHVHLLLAVPPSVSVSKIVETLKSVSSRKVRLLYRKELQHYLWRNRFWTKSYCAITVGDGATTEIIKRYIENQPY